ncbi:MAG: hypothetical protein WBG42_05065 [Cryomorphaceae bacterium]
MKTLATFLISLFIVTAHAQETNTVGDDIEPTVEQKLFQIHLPLILDNVKVTGKITTDSHDGGLGYYIDVGEYEELASRRAFFTKGIHTYAMTSEQLDQLYVENFLRLDSITNKGETTEYNFFSHTDSGNEIGIAATILNNTAKDTGPQLAEIHVLDMDDDFEIKEED